MYYEPNIVAAPVRPNAIARAALAGGLLSLLLWSLIIALALSFLSR